MTGTGSYTVGKVGNDASSTAHVAAMILGEFTMTIWVHIRAVSKNDPLYVQ